jgi:sarcosine oxidase subunit alpha
MLAPPAARGWARLLDRSPKPVSVPLAGPLSPLDVVGEIVAQRLDPALVTTLCAERCVLPRALQKTADTAPSPAHLPEGIPPYLEHRFGADQAQWTLIPTERRRFDPGCLVFANTDHRSPLDAVGVVLADEGGMLRALLGRMAMNAGETVYIRDGLTTISARLGQPL